MTSRLAVGTSLLVLAALLGPPSRADAQATIVVNSTGDADDGDDANGVTTLREAVRLANASGGASVIRFDAGELGANPVVRVLGGEYVITGSVTIDGRGLGQNLRLDAEGLSRVFNIDDGQTGLNAVQLLAIDLTGGNAIGDGEAGFGGAILNAEDLTLTDCRVTSCFASALGGGVYSFGGLTVDGGEHADNIAENGGAIGAAPGSAVTINGTRFADNFATFDGGGLFNQGDAEVTGATFVDNWAGGGGGLTNETRATMTIDSPVFTNNAADFGGAIDNSGELTITGGEFRGNTSTQVGGALSNFNGGVMRVSDALVEQNTCDQFGGGVSNEAGSAFTATNTRFVSNNAFTGAGVDNLGDATLDGCEFTENSATNGGAVYTLENGVVSIARSTFTGNTAELGGALHCFSGVEVIASAFVGNAATNYGGAISVEGAGSLEMFNSTLSANTATNYGAGVDNVGDARIGSCTFSGNAAGEGSAFFAFQGTFRIDDSLVNSPVAGAFNGRYNLFSEPRAAVRVQGRDNQFSADPRIAPLADNGGPTPTHALLPGSPAINAGDPNFDASRLPTDQRGGAFSRVVGGRVDVGAFESR